MSYMLVDSKGRGINGSNSKVPILEVGEGERISYLSDNYKTRKLEIYEFYEVEGCVAKIHTWPSQSAKNCTWKSLFKMREYYSNFTVVGNNPTVVNELIKKCEIHLGGRNLVFLPDTKSFKERTFYLINWLLKGKKN